jgi:hypothetical protein
MPGTTIQYVTVFLKCLQAGVGQMFGKFDPRRKLTSRILIVFWTDWALKERSLAGSGTHFSCRQALIARLVTLEFVELFTEPHAGFV